MIAIAMPRAELGTRAEARTKEILRCLQMKPQFIFMLDSDQTMPNYSMRALIEQKADIAVIDAPSQGGDDSNIRLHPDGTLAYATISCCLIKPEVFEKIEKPWFSSNFDFREEGTKNGKIQWNIQEKFKDNNRDEDIYFMRKVLDAGLVVKVVPELKCNHYQLEDI